MSMAPFVSFNPSCQVLPVALDPQDFPDTTVIQILIATCLSPLPPQSLGRAAVNLGFGVLDNLLELMHVYLLELIMHVY